MWNKIKRKIIEGRQGILFGAIAGFSLTVLVKFFPGLLDISFAATQPTFFEQATNIYVGNKFGILAIFWGAIIGFLIDINKKRLPLPKWLRRRL